MSKRTKAVMETVMCANPQCGKPFERKTKCKKYCSPECEEAVSKVRSREYFHGVKDGTRVRGSVGKTSFSYIERVKCPRCEAIYMMASDTPAGNIMRREYCPSCKRVDMDYFDIFATAGLGLRA